MVWSAVLRVIFGRVLRMTKVRSVSLESGSEKVRLSIPSKGWDGLTLVRARVMLSAPKAMLLQRRRMSKRSALLF